MPASDIPTTGGIPNTGGEGFRFSAIRLTTVRHWTSRHTDQTAGRTRLDTSCGGGSTRWIAHAGIFPLENGRQIPTAPINAGRVAFTLGRIYDGKSPPNLTHQPSQSALDRQHVKSWENSTIYTIAITRRAVQPFPYLATAHLIGQPDGMGEGRPQLDRIRERAGAPAF